MTDIGVNYTYFVFYGRNDELSNSNDDIFIGEKTCTHSDVEKVVALMNEVEEEHHTGYDYYFINAKKPAWRAEIRTKYGYMPLEND